MKADRDHRILTHNRSSGSSWWERWLLRFPRFAAERMRDAKPDKKARCVWSMSMAVVLFLVMCYSVARVARFTPPVSQGAVPGRAAGRTILPLQPVNVTSSYKVTDKNDVYWTFSYKLELTNPAPTPRAGKLEVSFLDAEGFEMDRATIYGVELAAREKQVISESTIIRVPAAIHVVGLTVHGKM